MQTDNLWPGWQTEGLIGKGGFGTVYRIGRTLFDSNEKAALKVITIPQSDSEIEELYNDGYDRQSVVDTYARHLKDIVNEYSIMRKLDSCVNIVGCDDVRYEQHSDGIGWDIYIKMELLTPLGKAFPGRVGEKAVIKLGKDLCNALQMCKRHGVIHRDIKPQNIFVSEAGDFKLGDFGVAKAVEKTMGGTKIGTYKYMAPEVYHGQPYGAGADIYSLGLVLYWLLNERRLPFLPMPPQVPGFREEEQAKALRFRGERIPAPKNGSPALQTVVLKACAFDPADRFQSAEEMRKALEAAEQGIVYDPEKTERIYAPDPIPDPDRTERVRHKPEMVDKTIRQAAENANRLAKNDRLDREMLEDAGYDVRRMGSGQKSDKKNTAVWILLVCLVVVLALLALIVWGVVGREEPEASEEPEAYTETREPTLPEDTATTRPTTTQPVTTQPPTAETEPTVQVGDYITLGRYEQDNNTADGPEEIRWRVLKVEGSRALVISQYALEIVPYNDEYAAVTWEDSALRSWMNDQFYYGAFTTQERNRILPTAVNAQANPYYDTNPGNSTRDYVFALSLQEANACFASDTARKCPVTDYLLAKGVYTHGGNYGWWWLRSPGLNTGSAAGVNCDGSISWDGGNRHVDGNDYEGFNVARPQACARPAMWIEIE